MKRKSQLISQNFKHKCWRKGY